MAELLATNGTISANSFAWQYGACLTTATATSNRRLCQFKARVAECFEALGVLAHGIVACMHHILVAIHPVPLAVLTLRRLCGSEFPVTQETHFRMILPANHKSFLEVGMVVFQEGQHVKVFYMAALAFQLSLEQLCLCLVTLGLGVHATGLFSCFQRRSRGRSHGWGCFAGRSWSCALESRKK